MWKNYSALQKPTDIQYGKALVHCKNKQTYNMRKFQYHRSQYISFLAYIRLEKEFLPTKNTYVTQV